MAFALVVIDGNCGWKGLIKIFQNSFSYSQVSVG